MQVSEPFFERVFESMLAFSEYLLFEVSLSGHIAKRHLAPAQRQVPRQGKESICIYKTSSLPIF